VNLRKALQQLVKEIQMPELRYNPIHQCWVSIATEHGMRPLDFANRVDRVRGESFCPFCQGKENVTPPEVYALRPDGSPPNGPGWELRVIPSRFRALAMEGELTHEAEGIFEKMNGLGVHEVVIETPQHDLGMADYPLERLREIIQALLRRLIDLKKDPRLRYIMIAKNHGGTAGASLAHSHTQLIAAPVIPPIVSTELASAREYYRENGRCLFCDLIEQELMAEERIVSQNDDLVTLVPFASQAPFELLIAPRKHQHAFAAITESETASLAWSLKDALTRLKLVLDDPAYNLAFHIAPHNNAESPPEGWATLKTDFHWHLEVIPRLVQVHGFERGMGFYVNFTPPEQAAAYLREAGPSEVEGDVPLR
jgi:UDPglucose--hexose-1-phosphate uridylyltransferase